MHRKRHRDIVHRYEGNPIITIDDLSFRSSDICNAGAIKIDGEYILLVTIQNLEGTCSIYPARSRDGYSFEVAATPLLKPSEDPGYAEHEEKGVLDPRIVSYDGVYYICYDGFGRHGYRGVLARTRDFRSVERVRLMTEPDTKGAVLFPKKIGGKYARLERPWAGSGIWLTYSDDLEYWGWSEVVIAPRPGFWDFHRIGVGSPPLRIAEGWLVIYYGVKETISGPLFRLGAAILDGENPLKVVGRTNVPILTPREEYERIGDVPNLIFLCGAVIEPDDEVKFYYGASNSCICVGTTKLESIIEACSASYREF